MTTPLRLLPIVALLALIPTGCGSSSDDGGTPPPPPPPIPDAIDTLLSGDDDFATLAANMARADPSDPGVRMVLAVAGFLDAQKTQAMTSGAGLQDLYTRSGYRLADPNANFWEIDFVEVGTDAGDIIDTIPTLTEFADYLDGTFRSSIDALATSLDSLPTTFELVITIDSSNSSRGLLSDLDPSDYGTYRLDYGDAQAVVSGLRTILAHIDLIAGHDWDSVNINDFDQVDHPNRDPLDHIESVYPNLGNVRRQAPDRHLLARQHLQEAWSAYLNASQHIRNETPIQQDQGLLTLGSRFFTPGEKAQFLTDEQDFRTWAQEIVDHFALDQFYTFDQAPDGTALPTEDQVQINFAKFFQGVDVRNTFFKLVTDPIDEAKVPGVSDPSGFTADMKSFGGVLGQIGGRTVENADVHNLAYVLRVDSPPVDTKTIGGGLGDWATNSLTVASTSMISAGQDLGNLKIAKDSGHLYVLLDRDLSSAADYYEISIAGETSTTYLSSWMGSIRTGNGISYAHVPGEGLELSFDTSLAGPKGWIRLSFEAMKFSGGDQFDEEFGEVLVNVQ